MIKRLSLLVCSLICVSNIFAQLPGNGVTTYPSNLGLPSSAYAKRSSFVIDHNGRKWVGFNSGLSSSAILMMYNDTTWRRFTWDFAPGTKVTALAVDANNDLWIGTPLALYKFHDTTIVLTINNINVTSLACGGGNVYAGTYSGLAVYNGSAFTYFNKANNGMNSDTILSITYENSSAIWLGNSRGLEKFDGSTGFFFNNVQASQPDSVMCIYIDGANNKWLGTNHHGVIKYDNSNYFTMPQLYGTPLGVNWPTRTYSIGKGPNGGIFFSNHHRINSVGPQGFNIAGSIELVGSQTKTYAWVAYSSQPISTIFNYPIISYDAVSNKLFYVGVDQTVNPFLYSFDASQFYWPNITQSNSDYLDINNVQALITSNADMGWDCQGTKYFVPKGSNSSPLRAAALWMGGYHNGGLRMGAMTYRQNGADFWPGPLNSLTDSIDQATSTAYDKVWKVNRFDIANFIYNWNAGNVQAGTFYAAPGIVNWPGDNVHPLAPYVDVNSNGIYDPLTGGDYPIIKGDQMIWWVFNDRLMKHSETGGGTMGVQVNASAYAFVCPNIADSNRVLNYTTFYNYKVINFSPDKLDSFYVSPWIDADLGNYQDDYIGCDVSNNYGFIYNGDNFDEDANGLTGYHTNMPAFSCNILSGPLADVNDGKDNDNDGVVDNANERCMMHTFTYYTNTGDPMTGNPNTNSPVQYYNFMNARWKNGVPMTYGGNGTTAGQTTCRHLFPGNSDPYGVSMGGTAASPIPPPGSFGTTGWTESQANVVKGDMRFLIGVGPFTMQPGGSYEIDYALVFSQDSANCDSNAACVLTRAQADNIRVKRWFDNNSFPSCLSLNGVGIKENSPAQLNVSIYPNPATDQVFVEFKDSHSKATVEVLDLLGNLVKGATFLSPGKYVSLPVADFAPGVYVIRISTPSGQITKKFVKE